MSSLTQSKIPSDPRGSRPGSTDPHRSRPLHILFVHREADTVECCLKELKKAQFVASADTSLDLVQCTEQLRSQSYDVVVAEYPSPCWKGSQGLQFLRQTVEDIPLLFVTTSKGNESIAELTAHGAFDYVEGEHIAQLPMAVRRALNEKKLREELEEAGEALKHSQSLYHALVDNPAYGVCRCDVQGKFLNVNQALVTMLGYATKEELLAANHASDGVFDLGTGSALTERSSETMRINPIEVEWKRKNGTTLKVKLSGLGIYDEHGDCVGHEIIAVDITEPRTLEEQLRHQASSPDHCVCLAFEDLTEQRKAARPGFNQAQLLDLVTDAIFVRDMDGRVTYWNQSAERMYGWTKQDMLGQSTFEVLKTDSPIPLEEIQKVLLREGHWEGKLSHSKKDGTRITVASYWTLQRDETGRPVGWFQINEDVTEERRAEEARRESEEGFRLLVDGVKDYAIFRLDPRGQVVTWNPGASRIKGYLKEEIIGKHFSVFYPPEDIASGKPEEALRIAAEKGRCEDEGWRVRKDGSPFWANAIITALRDEAGQLRGFAKVTGDITERRAVEKARQEAQALQQRTTEITLLSQLGTLLHACLTTEEAFKVFGQFASRLFTSESGALYILSPSRNVLESAAVWGDFPAGEQVFPPDDCWAIRSGRMHYVEELT